MKVKKGNKAAVMPEGKWYENQHVLIFLLVTITFLVYFQVLQLGFTMLDDSIFITENQQYNKDLANLVHSFQRGLFNPDGDIYYRPLFLVDFILEWQLFGLNVTGYHFSNLVFHITSVVLLYYFFKAVGIKRMNSFVLALLFALHPVLSQAVAWIPGRNDMLLMIFFLTTVLLALRFVDNKHWYLLVLQGIALVLALFTKETAVIIPLVLLGLIIFVKKAPWKIWIPMTAVWIGAILLWVFVRLSATLIRRDFTVLELIRNGIERVPAFIQYLGKIFFPFNLSVFPAISQTTIWWGVAALIILIFLILQSRSYFNVLTIVGLIWFILFLLPVLVVPPTLNDQVFEHRLYIPVVGILLMLSQTSLFRADGVPGRNETVRNGFIRNFRPILAGFVLLLYTILTLTRIGYFKDPVAFWGHAVEDNPTSAYANMMLGLRQTDSTEMKRYFVKAYELNPDEKMVNYLLGRVELEAGNIQQAEYHLKRELKISRIPDNYFNLAKVYFTKNNLDSAAWCLEQVIAITPMHSQANYNLSLLYLQLNRKEEALKLVATMRQNGLEVPKEFSGVH